MAASDIRKFKFNNDLKKYLWSPTDFSNLQTWILSEIEGLFEGLTGGAILKGLVASPSTGLTINISSGIGVSPSGRIVVVESSFQSTFVSPVGNPARSLVVLRPKLTDSDQIPKPLDPSTLIYLDQKYEYDVVVLAGTPAANPSYPALQSDDIVVAAVYLTAGHTTINYADFDLGKLSRARKKKLKIFARSGTYTADGTEDVVEMDGSSASGLVVLPPAADAVGEEIAVIKTDSSANSIAVSGNGAELISGQNSFTLDSQWDRARMYSNGTAWRIL